MIMGMVIVPRAIIITDHIMDIIGHIIDINITDISVGRISRINRIQDLMLLLDTIEVIKF